MASVPKRLQLTDDGGLRITWSDGDVRVCSARELYECNPAADARAEREKKAAELDEKARGREGRPEGAAKVGNLMLSVITPEQAMPRRVVGVTPAGNYAYAIRFNHGSSAGLYRLDLLRQLGRPEAAAETSDV